MTAYWTDDDISPEANDAIEDLFKHLAELRGHFAFDSDARRRWVEWHDENAKKTADEAGIMAGVASKLPRQLARVVLVLHCLQSPQNAGRLIALDTMDAGIAIVEYHRAHARKAPSKLGSAGSSSPARIRDRIVKILGEGVSSVSSQPGVRGTIYRKPLSMDWIPRSVLYRALGGQVAKLELDEAIDTLEEDGWLERRSVGA